MDASKAISRPVDFNEDRVAEKHAHDAAAPPRLMHRVNSPADLKKLTVPELMQLALELREYLVEVVARTGGHLAPSLGVVELTIALHYLYDSPTDKIVWDVGHQAYVHKMLTGRRDRLPTIRQHGGIS